MNPYAFTETGTHDFVSIYFPSRKTKEDLISELYLDVNVDSTLY